MLQTISPGCGVKVSLILLFCCTFHYDLFLQYSNIIFWILDHFVQRHPVSIKVPYRGNCNHIYNFTRKSMCSPYFRSEVLNATKTCRKYWGVNLLAMSDLLCDLRISLSSAMSTSQKAFGHFHY